MQSVEGSSLLTKDPIISSTFGGHCHDGDGGDVVVVMMRRIKMILMIRRISRRWIWAISHLVNPLFCDLLI